MAAATNIRALRRQEFEDGIYVRITIYQFTLDIPSISGNSFDESTAAIPGLQVSKDIVLGWTHNAEPTAHDIVQEMHVGAADTLHIYSHNSSGSPVDPASVVYRVVIARLNV
jgi:hypothetical protein